MKLKNILKIWGLCLPFFNRVVLFFFFDKFYLYIKFIKNEVFYEKRKIQPFRWLYAY